MGKTNEKATIELIIKGQQAKTTLKDVRTSMIGLERELSKMKKDDDPAGYKKLTRQLHLTRQAHAQMIQEIRGGEGSFKRLKEMALGVLGGNLLERGIDMLKAGIVATISKAGELSDELSDVQKTTNLTAQQVYGLNSILQKLNTRTSVQELRSLAEEAGRLGYSGTKEIVEFVKAADMINVALGDSLGEGATKDIAKLTDIFKLKELYGIEGAMLRVGSAINDIGMASTASEGYIVDFLKRMSGISGVANVSVQELIAMAGTLDSLGQTSEVSSTALNKLLVKMGSDVPTYAKMANVSVDEFRKVMQRSAVEGLMLVLKEVGKTTTGIEELAGTLGELGLDGGRVVGVLGTLAKNTGEYSRQLGISNKAFAQNTSIVNEFNIKNTNGAAVMERMGKSVSNFWENVQLAILPAIVSFGKMVGAVSELELNMAKLAEQQEKVAAGEGKLPLLTKRYEELTSKATKSAVEQRELNTIMQQITEIVPEAATEFDKYGNVLSIGTDRVRAYVDEQRSLLEAMRQTRRELLNEEMGGLEGKAVSLQANLNRGTVREQQIGAGGSILVERKLTRNEISDMQSELKKIRAEIQTRRQDLKALEGIATIEERRNGRGYGFAKKKGDGSVPPDSGLSEDAREKIKKDQESLNDKLLQNQQQLTVKMMEEHEKELLAAKYMYDELRKLAHGKADDLKTISLQEAQEVDQINQKFNQKYLTDFDKTIRGQLVKSNKAAADRDKFNKDLSDKERERVEGERGAINSKYEAMLAEAEVYGYNTVEIYNLWMAELNKLQQEQAKKEIDLVQKTVDEKKKAEKDLKKEKDKALGEEITRIDRISEAAGYGSDALTSILELSAKNQEQNAEFQKTVGLFQIAIDSATAISAAIATATKGGDGYTIALRIAAAVATVSAGILKAKQLIQEANAPQAPAYREHGGSTDLGSVINDTSGNPEGWYSRPTLFQLGRRSYVVGEKNKREYVLSDAMLKNPAIANFAGTVEALRQQRFFENGGFTSQGSTSSTPPAYDPRIDETNRLLKILINKPSGINYHAFEEYERRIDLTRSRASA